MAENYEIHNPEIDATQKAIAAKIRQALPDGWGFMLMIFEVNKDDGANFYSSTADRHDVITVLEEWIARQREALTELNQHPSTFKLRGHWHKLVAVLLAKYADVLGDVVITREDLDAIAEGAMPFVVVDDRADGLHLSVTDKTTALELAQAEAARVEALSEGGAS